MSVFRILSGGPPADGIRRALLRAPIALYRAGLGGLLGRRLVLLTHTGRVSGEPRRVVLEVIGPGDQAGEYLIASGYGTRSQWARNVLAHPEVRYQVGRRRYRGTATPLPPDESGRRLAAYAAHHPRLAERLLSSLGHDPRSSEEYRAIGADREHGVPIFVLRPDR